jgi:autoinducer 2 (AI-2) kinase
VIFAGGAAKSDLWAQIVADVLQVPVQIPVLKEATALGTALCAAVAVGSYSSLAEAGIASVKWDRIVEPNPSNKSTYDEGYERWLKSYPPQLELVKDGVTEAMWRAPGI